MSDYLGTATYSPEDNKLRFYPYARLDKPDYDRVKAAGFSWAPKQELFVAPMWTPEREDLLIEWCGEVEDEDKSLVERAEERSDRFSDYSRARAKDADDAHRAVSAIADNIPLGQPILVGHHSEKHARKDAAKIENGMRRAVKMWEQSQYWKDRAKGAIRAAKYKELPSVRARRIKGLEADQRKQEKARVESLRFIALWETLHDDQHAKFKKKDGTTGTFLERARFLSNLDGCILIREPFTENGAQHWHTWSAWDVLRPDAERYKDCPSRTPEQVQAGALANHRARIARYDRWLTHYANRLEYERAMLAEAGAIATDKTGPEVGGGCQCWASHRGGWSYIQKVNKVFVTVLDNWGNSSDRDGSHNFTRTIAFDKLSHVMTRAEVEEKRAAGVLVEAGDKTGFFLLDAPPPKPKPATTPEPGAAKFDQLKDALKEGVKVVTAPQLFPTPPGLARRMVELADIRAGHRVLEPSAGTGAIIEALPEADFVLTAVEINNALCRRLNTMPQVTRTIENDFLLCNGDLGLFDRVLMNPPFVNGEDIKHITHALNFLKPGGRLVAICANGPRQNDKLRPMVEDAGGDWEPLPADTFKESGTGVNTVLLVMDKPESSRS